MRLLPKYFRMKIREKIKSIRFSVKKDFTNKNKRIVFILGCQRSGTTLLCKIFSADSDAKVFGEKNRLTIGYDPKTKTDRLSLKPLTEVKTIVHSTPAPLVIIKPLVESQNALTLLSFFKGSKILWVYRHFKDVIASNLRNWGVQNGIMNLSHVVENTPNNWRSEHVPKKIRELSLRHYSKAMNPYDAAALFWYVRNWFFFELNLDKNPDVMIFRYEDLVTNPATLTTQIYQFIRRSYPGKQIVRQVRASSIGKGCEVQLSPDVESLCTELLIKLDKVYRGTGHHKKPVPVEFV